MWITNPNKDLLQLKNNNNNKYFLINHLIILSYTKIVMKDKKYVNKIMSEWSWSKIITYISQDFPLERDDNEETSTK